MNTIKLLALLMAFLVIISSSVLSCAHKELSDNKAEKWLLQFIGETKGTVDLSLKRKQIANDTYSVAGSFQGMVSDHLGGDGRIECTLSGHLSGNAFQVRISGTGNMARTVDLNGVMRGKIDQFHGSGSYIVMHQEGSSKGTWVMKIIQ